MTGQTFGLLTVLDDNVRRITPSGVNRRCVLVKCVCSKTRVIEAGKVRSGVTKSCGCMSRTWQLQSRGHNFQKQHSMHSLFPTWNNMISRCTKPDHKSYKNYGGRGVTVCVEWLGSFEQFRLDMGERPEGCTLDRIDNNKGYSASNCRWSTMREQAQNRRGNRFITVRGETKTLSEWARVSGLSINTLHSRLRAGWANEKAILTPLTRYKQRNTAND